MPPSCKQTAGIKVFSIPENESALAGTNRSVKDRFLKSGLIPEHSLTTLAPAVIVKAGIVFSIYVSLFVCVCVCQPSKKWFQRPLYE